MTSNMKMIWRLGPCTVSRTPKYEHNMEQILDKYENSAEVAKSHYFLICFILCSYYFHMLGPATQAQAPKLRQGPGPGLARRCFGAQASPKNGKILWKWYEMNMKIMRFGTFARFRIISTCWGLGPRSGPQNFTLFHISDNMILILFSYVAALLVWSHFHSQSLEPMPMQDSVFSFTLCTPFAKYSWREKAQLLQIYGAAWP